MKIEFETQVNSILNKAQKKLVKLVEKVWQIIDLLYGKCWFKGTNINIAQMISCLGQQNVDGKRIPYGFEDRTLPHYTKYDDSPEARGFVESSFIQGLTLKNYFHAMGGRTGLIDTAVKTSLQVIFKEDLLNLWKIKLHYDMTVRNNKNKIIQFDMVMIVLIL